MIPRTLEGIIVDLYHRHQDLERRVEMRERTGTVVEVNAEEGWARVKISEDPVTGKPFLSPRLPWKEAAMGTIRTHYPPSVGEQVKIVSESGDLTDGVIDASLPSDQNQRPHDKEGEAMTRLGSTYMHFTDKKFEIRANHIRFVAKKIDHDEG